MKVDDPKLCAGRYHPESLPGWQLRSGRVLISAVAHYRLRMFAKPAEQLAAARCARKSVVQV